mmetsp:Transcript_15750/g.46012  ORF Transcript_15750/g.46012 Transcript_15750/m.46012 type:complete len:201 (-) Transcript_15750:142-744(-)
MLRTRNLEKRQKKQRACSQKHWAMMRTLRMPARRVRTSRWTAPSHRSASRPSLTARWLSQVKLTTNSTTMTTTMTTMRTWTPLLQPRLGKPSEMACPGTHRRGRWRFTTYSPSDPDAGLASDVVYQAYGTVADCTPAPNRLVAHACLPPSHSCRLSRVAWRGGVQPLPCPAAASAVSGLPVTGLFCLPLLPAAASLSLAV